HRRVLAAAPGRGVAAALRRADRARADLLARAGQPSGARTVLEGLLRSASRVERPALLAELAELDTRLGERTRAAARLRLLIDRHPESDEALALLEPPSSPGLPLLRPSALDSAAVLAARGRPREAAQALTPTADPALLARRAEVRFRSGDLAAAARDYEEAIARGGPATALRMELAKTWARAGETSRARGLYRALLDGEPSGRRASTLTYLIADLFQEEGLADSAAAWFRRLGERWPRADLAPRGLLRLGHLELARGRAAAAEGAYRSYLARHPAGGDRREARYWLGRALAESGREDEASRLFAELATPAADDWYAALARHRLARSEAEIETAVFGRAADPGRRTAGAAAADAARSASLAADTVVQPGPEAGALRRARALLLAGDSEGAAHEVGAAAAAAGGDPPPLRRVARWALARGFPETTFRLGSALAAANPGDAGAAALAHAAAYPALVLHEAEELELPASLLWAVARRESRFDPAARSPVGATGLLQLMPATARDEAARERLPTFDPADLRRPEPNLHLGAAHLRRLLDGAGGRWEVALAAYNAGAHAAGRWTEFPESRTPEGFVERIPFRETRAYVKLVLAARARYEELHGR
ncbi:MAG TPA: transglycosylase SLT domain-containing protein, partial [Gemmatimonadota bacterium]